MNPHDQLAHYWAEIDKAIGDQDPAGDWDAWTEKVVRSLMVKVELYSALCLKY